MLFLDNAIQEQQEDGSARSQQDAPYIESRDGSQPQEGPDIAAHESTRYPDHNGDDELSGSLRDMMNFASIPTINPITIQDRIPMASLLRELCVRFAVQRVCSGLPERMDQTRS